MRIRYPKHCQSIVFKDWSNSFVNSLYIEYNIDRGYSPINRDFTLFGQNGGPCKSIVTIVTMKSQSPEQCKVEVQIVRICGSNLEPRDFSAKILAVKCSDFTLDSGSVRFQYTSVTFSDLILAPIGA